MHNDLLASLHFFEYFATCSSVHCMTVNQATPIFLPEVSEAGPMPPPRDGRRDLRISIEVNSPIKIFNSESDNSQTWLHFFASSSIGCIPAP